MKTKMTKILIACSLLFAVNLFTSNTAQAQLPYGYYLDFWQHQTPTIENAGGWIDVYLYPEGTAIGSWWNPNYYTITVKVRYNNGTTVNLSGSMFSSGIEAYVPARPSNTSNYPTLTVTLTHKQGAHAPYTFSGAFYQK